ncbi:MAG: ABC transporter ATP-binding protein, partial [Marivita lacus]|nr:ABC transporter ATP-binding protein [Marivita lacus]
VQAALEALSKGRTTLVIAHRLSTIRDAHKIVVMDRGRVIEEGTHDALLARSGTYAALHQMQMRD